ncbi:SMC5-SMC6 complex localization factor protein 2 isoform X2 [Eleginops maclovinus]|uniref:SMC5-SMC6 complex localization factor protein 2 isoform X2 n=1 Tax=Eleginops maclovinus TaxID=56733 RepID=UPI00308005DF
MKPSHYLNRFYPPPPSRMLPFPSPERPNRNIPCPPWPPYPPPGPIFSPGFVPRTPPGMGPSGNRFQFIPIDSPAPHPHQNYSPPGFFLPGYAPIISPNRYTPAPRPPSVFPPASPQFMTDFNYPPPSNIRRDETTESRINSPCSGSQNATPQSQESNKDQQHQRTPSRGNLITVDLNSSSQKRCRESEDRDNGAKKLCHLAINSVKAQTPTPTPSNSASTSLLSQPSARHSSVLELSPKTTGSHPGAEPALKPTQSSCASLSPKRCIPRRPQMGAKQAYFKSIPKHALTIKLRSLSAEERQMKRSEENDKQNISSPLLSSEVPQEDTVGSSHVQLGSHHSADTHRSSSVLPVKPLSKCDDVEKSGKSECNTSKPASKTDSGSLSTVERNNRLQRPVAHPSDIGTLFTPDPSIHGKTSKPKMDGIKSTTSEKSSSSSTVTSSTTPLTGSSSCKVGPPQAVDPKVSYLSLSHNSNITMPTVTLERVNLESLKSIFYRASEPKDGSITSSGWELKDQSLKSDEKHKNITPPNVRPSTSETCTTTSTPHPLPERRPSEGHRKLMNKEDPIDGELDNSSEDEHLLSLQEIMAPVSMPPDTPSKGAFSEPSTPKHNSCKSTNQPLAAGTLSAIYKNSLDQMLEEISINQRGKQSRTQVLIECKEDLLEVAEYEEAEENRDVAISTEQQKFLQRYSLMSTVFREVPPGKTIFNLEKFGRIFNQEDLQLRRCMVNPQGTAQKTLLWSSPVQLRLHLNIELFQEAYDGCSPCPTQVSSFLFKMMSVHRERIVSEKILKTLCDLAQTTAYQIVKNGNQQFEVWVPSLADLVLVLMNMGVEFVSLFPFEHLQPPFTEGDLREDIRIQSESPSSNEVQSNFPEHNCNNILKYLSYCMGLCLRAYSDDELLLLLIMMGRVGLDPRLVLESSVELCALQFHIVNNIKDWDTMLPKICVALTDVTDDHHNMCYLVKLLPDNARGKQLRRHLSVCMISKLLNGSCTYRPKGKEFQLSELRNYLPQMQPSNLLQGLLNSSSRSQKDQEDEDVTNLDHQAYYICYSLLTLADEASNIQFFLAPQKKQLLFLCSELETHVKCDIRENEKCLYRSKVKDLVARIYTRWQLLLQRTRPLHGKLYDYWQPVDTVMRTQKEQETDVSDNEEPVMEKDEEE